jgi:hypothetical protein
MGRPVDWLRLRHLSATGLQLVGDVVKVVNNQEIPCDMA